MKRFLSFILVAALCFGLLPAAFAQESTRQEELAELEKKAEAGDAEAMCALGKELFLLQRKSLEDYEVFDAIAYEWFKKAEALNCPDAYYWLGLMCKSGRSPEVNLDIGNSQEIALGYFEKGVEAGHTGCMVDMGSILLYSFSVPRDEARAMFLFESAAEQGDSEAMAVLALEYKLGNNVPRDDKMALEWYEKSAELGNRGSLEALSEMYYSGDGVPKDMAKYEEYYNKARALLGEELELQRQASIYFYGE